MPIDPNPSAWAASRYRVGTASKPARKFSVLNAPPHSITASQAAVKAFGRIPACGSAKYSMKIWTRIGVFRMIST